MSRVGERLRIAILPFENRGSAESMDLLDKLITVFVNLDRFKVLERAQLEKVLQEHQLGMSGFLDATTAAEIGKGIGVDAVVTGSISWNQAEVGVDARFIDTETAAIISARDAYARSTDLRSLNEMLEQLAEKFRGDLPVVMGYVINVEPDKITFDLGRNKNVKKGMKCYVYREGAPIIHPVSKEVIGKMIDILCEAQLQDVYEGYSIGKFITRKGVPSIGDMVITK
jgi:TolB-like protein